MSKYVACSRAKHINSWRRFSKGLRDKVAPYIFTAFLGAWLDGADWNLINSGNLGKFLASSKGLGVGALISTVLWGGSAFFASRYQKGVGTLFIVSALRPGAPHKDLESGAIGRAFQRVKKLRHVELKFGGPQGGGRFRFTEMVKQSVVDFSYALGDDDRDSADNILINSEWWFGWGFGARMASPDNDRFFPKRLFQWYTPASNKPEGTLDVDHSIGGEGVWACDVLSFEDFRKKLDRRTAHGMHGDLVLDFSPRKGVDPLKVDTDLEECQLASFSLPFSGTRGSGKRVIILELGPQSLTTIKDTRVLLEEKETAGDFTRHDELRKGAFGKLLYSVNPSSIHWITWRYGRGREESDYMPLKPMDFERALLAILPEIERASHLHDTQEVVVVASIPDAMQVPLGFGLERLYPNSLNRTRFAAYNQSEEEYRIVDLSDAPATEDTPALTRLENLTPHPVVLLDVKHAVLARWEPDGRVAFLSEERLSTTVCTLADGTSIQIARIRHGATDSLPQPIEGVGYIASRLTAMANPGRQDLLFPADEVRGPEGRIIGCRRLGRLTNGSAGILPS